MQDPVEGPASCVTGDMAFDRVMHVMALEASAAVATWASIP
jgi:hypothetical protein